MISEKEAERIEQWIKEAVDGGVKVLIGGKREKNLFYPTVITNAKKG